MLEDDIRIGVFICHCGVNIGGVVNISELRDFSKKLDDVVFVEESEFMCSSIGQNLIKTSAKKYNLNRILIASCSPKMHELTFRDLLKEINLNPYLLEIVNLREQCSWCHSEFPKAATEKAKNLIKMAVARLKYLEPLASKEVPIKRQTLIIGGGIAGMRAAIDVSKQGFPVYLLEKKPYLGGHIVQHNILYPNHSNPSEVYNKFVKQIKNEDLKIILNSELEKVEGYIGNYRITIKKHPEYVNNLCNLCGECEKVCPIEINNEFNFFMNKCKAIHLPFPNVYPRKYIIDYRSCTKCGKCLEICKRNAINLKAKEETVEFEVGTIIVATGFEIYTPVNEYGFGNSSNIITLLELERLLNKSGPTQGEIKRLSDGKKPKRIVFIGCVGSREPSDVDTLRHYCSRICCSSIMMNSIHLKEIAPDIDLVVLYRDLRTHGRGHERLYTLARKNGVKFIRYSVENKPEVIIESKKDNFSIKVYDTSLQTNFIIPCDVIVLASATIAPLESDTRTTKLRITLSQDELHPKLAPLDTISKGIYVAGAAQGPKDVIDSIAQASGAAAKVIIPMEQGQIPIESIVAQINENLCSGCGICEESCAFNAIKLESINSIKVAKVIEAACKGCGVCGASCPAGAIKMLHFTDKQIYSALEALLKSS
ncbi:MAG: 4Fe-4S binding protein [Candidatus Helarchaeota archaeon]